MLLKQKSIEQIVRELVNFVGLNYRLKSTQDSALLAEYKEKRKINLKELKHLTKKYGHSVPDILEDYGYLCVMNSDEEVLGVPTYDFYIAKIIEKKNSVFDEKDVSFYVTRTEDNDFRGIGFYRDFKENTETDFFTVENKCVVNLTAIENRLEGIYQKYLRTGYSEGTLYTKHMKKFIEKNLENLDDLSEDERKKIFFQKAISDIVDSYLFYHEPVHVDNDAPEEIQETIAYLNQLLNSPNEFVLAQLNNMKKGTIHYNAVQRLKKLIDIEKPLDKLYPTLEKLKKQDKLEI